MIRGMLIGFIGTIIVGLWARRQPAIPHHQRHRLVVTEPVMRMAQPHVDTILHTIERESPWILKPNVKPSNNSSVQS